MTPLPIVDVGRAKGTATAAAAPQALAEMIGTARGMYSAPGVAVGDLLSRAWLRRSASPYADELRAVAAACGSPGAYALNLSYEWACTTGAADDPEHGGPTLARVLDWSFDGLGRHLMAARCVGDAGNWLSLTWPGYVGALTCVAPGRFSAAINQPPPLPTGRGPAADWLATRARLARSRAMPPSHLLRLAFETCRTYAEARRLLCETEICIPVLFTLAGTEPGECCVIERLNGDFRIREGALAATANHWASFPYSGDARGTGSDVRKRAMEAMLRRGPDWRFRWLAPPVLNLDSRVAMMANARTGRVTAFGLEEGRRATEILDADLSASDGRTMRDA